MEIKYGTPVKDVRGNMLGPVNRVIKDSWSGDIRRFAVARNDSVQDLFISPEDVMEATDTEIKLRINIDVDS
jgi:hypothetical protein